MSALLYGGWWSRPRNRQKYLSVVSGSCAEQVKNQTNHNTEHFRSLKSVILTRFEFRDVYMVNIFSAKVNMLNFPRRCVSAGVFFCFIALSYGYVMTENQIKEDIKFLSQTVDGVKPSRLRALLLADLRRALPTVRHILERIIATYSNTLNLHL